MPNFIMVDKIEIPPRQRQKIEARPLADLRDSIVAQGHLQPIVVLRTGAETFRLIAGGRRLEAIKELHRQNVSIQHGSMPVPKGAISAVILKEADLPSLLQMEFDENKIREPLTWQEETAAIRAIVEARKAAEPGVTRTQIAAEQAAKQPVNAPQKTAGTIDNDIRQSLAVSYALDNRPDLQRAKSAREAYAILLKERHEAFEAEFRRRQQKKVMNTKCLWELKHGDLLKVLLDLPDNEVDLILADPPYGQGVNEERFAAGVSHRYDDSEENAQRLAIFIIQEGWRLTKPKANLFLFCNWKQFGVLFAAASQYGWTPWYHPIVWQKGEGGHSPWGRQGFRHDYEMLFFATKGQRGVNGPISDVLSFNRVGSRAKQHGAEKPLDLLEFLITRSTYPHDLVLDPCFGSGSAPLAAVRVGRRVIGCELDEIYYNRAMVRLGNFDAGKPDVDIVSEKGGDNNG